MKLENEKIEKRFISKATHAKNEKWLYEQSRKGWHLFDVREHLFYADFYFRKCSSCDNAYFAPVSFAKLSKYSNISLSVIQHIKNTNGGKRVFNREDCHWICIPKNKIKNPDDVKKNLLYREKCISKEYFFYFIWCAISALVLLIVGIFAHLSPVYFILPSAIGVISFIFVFKLIIHSTVCKRVYTRFLE